MFRAACSASCGAPPSGSPRTWHFPQVVSACAAPRDAIGGTWITPEMHSAYCELHRLGVAHSIEVWAGDALVGGLYGVRTGAVFCGESMFSRESNASKAALAWLARSRPGTRHLPDRLPDALGAPAQPRQPPPAARAVPGMAPTGCIRQV